jgi:thiamine-phosphate pyrophosphorylase
MKQINGGLYLVVDPMPGLQIVLPKIKAALDGGVDVIQLWNHWNGEGPHQKFIVEVCNCAHQYDVPVLVNEHWEWLQTLPLDGIHFNTIPKNFDQIKKVVNRPLLMGITCGNTMAEIRWAIDNNLDYISFCSVFHSSTANSCELVQPDIIKQTRSLTDMPIYGAGGITYDNISTLLSLGINGVAIVSGIMKAEDPEFAAKKFKHCLTNKIPYLKI